MKEMLRANFRVGRDTGQPQMMGIRREGQWGADHHGRITHRVGQIILHSTGYMVPGMDRHGGGASMNQPVCKGNAPGAA